MNEDQKAPVEDFDTWEAPEHDVHHSPDEAREVARFRRMIWHHYGYRYVIWLILAGVVFYVVTAYIVGSDIAEFWSNAVESSM